MPDRYGISAAVWEQGKAEIRGILVARARKGKTIPYSELVGLSTIIHFEPRDPKLFDMLGQISEEEDAEGHGMLSAIVVHKEGDQMPGPGFFDWAKHLGRDTSDILKCWIEEVNKVFNYWQSLSVGV